MGEPGESDIEIVDESVDLPQVSVERSSPLDSILSAAVFRSASDVHLVIGQPPTYRIDGEIIATDRPPLTTPELAGILEPLLDPTRQETWAQTRQLCFSLRRPGIGIFRVSIYSHLGRMEAAIRVGRAHLPTPEQLGIPSMLLDLVHRPDGLILVTGPTGAGKTTTLNALLRHVNTNQRRKIITIEDPVEFLMPPGKSVVVQQEIGLDAPDFGSALRHALRQDPDVICVGEMRDLPTIATALTAAETGHLVLATLHTTGAVGTISRIIDVFPAPQQPQIRVQLSQTLRAVISQALVRRAKGPGRLLAYELLPITEAVRNVIRVNKAHQLRSIMQTGSAAGMVMLDSMLKARVESGDITRKVARMHALDPDRFRPIE